MNNFDDINLFNNNEIEDLYNLSNIENNRNDIENNMMFSFNSKPENNASPNNQIPKSALLSINNNNSVINKTDSSSNEKESTITEKKNNNDEAQKKINVMSFEETKLYFEESKKQAQIETFQKKFNRQHFRKKQPDGVIYNEKTQEFEKLPDIAAIDNEIESLMKDQSTEIKKFQAKPIEKNISNLIMKNPEKSKEILLNTGVKKVDPREAMKDYNKMLVNEILENSNKDLIVQKKREATPKSKEIELSQKNNEQLEQRNSAEGIKPDKIICKRSFERSKSVKPDKNINPLNNSNHTKDHANIMANKISSKDYENSKTSDNISKQNLKNSENNKNILNPNICNVSIPNRQQINKGTIQNNTDRPIDTVNRNTTFKNIPVSQNHQMKQFYNNEYSKSPYNNVNYTNRFYDSSHLKLINPKLYNPSLPKYDVNINNENFYCKDMEYIKRKNIRDPTQDFVVNVKVDNFNCIMPNQVDKDNFSNVVMTLPDFRRKVLENLNSISKDNVYSYMLECLKYVQHMKVGPNNMLKEFVEFRDKSKTADKEVLILALFYYIWLYENIVRTSEKTNTLLKIIQSHQIDLNSNPMTNKLCSPISDFMTQNLMQGSNQSIEADFNNKERDSCKNVEEEEVYVNCSVENNIKNKKDESHTHGQNKNDTDKVREKKEVGDLLFGTNGLLSNEISKSPVISTRNISISPVPKKTGGDLKEQISKIFNKSDVNTKYTLDQKYEINKKKEGESIPDNHNPNKTNSNPTINIVRIEDKLDQENHDKYNEFLKKKRNKEDKSQIKNKKKDNQMKPERINLDEDISKYIKLDESFSPKNKRLKIKKRRLKQKEEEVKNSDSTETIRVEKCSRINTYKNSELEQQIKQKREKVEEMLKNDATYNKILKFAHGLTNPENLENLKKLIPQESAKIIEDAFSSKLSQNISVDLYETKHFKIYANLIPEENKYSICKKIKDN